MANETKEQWVVVITIGGGDTGTAYGSFVPAAAAEHALYAQKRLGDFWLEGAEGNVYALPLGNYEALSSFLKSQDKAMAEIKADSAAAEDAEAAAEARGEQAECSQPPKPPLEAIGRALDGWDMRKDARVAALRAALAAEENA